MNIPFPTTVDLAVTGKCNLRCKHCNTSGTWNLDNELSFDEWKGVLDQLKEEKVFNISLFGGEPFAYGRIIEFLELLNEYPLRVTILTNGTLIGEKEIEAIGRLKYLSSVQVSIDGSSAEVHDWQRGEGSFEKAIASVKKLAEECLPVNMKAVINRHNYRDIENMLKLALDLGLGGMDFGDAVECGRASVFADQMRFEGEVHRQIMETMFRLKKQYKEAFIGGTLGQKVQMLHDFYDEGEGAGKRGTFSTCPAGQNMLSVRSDGKVVPCSAFWTLICGDVRERSLREIWDSSEVLDSIRELEDVKLEDNNPECANCDYLSHCNGGCRASAYYSTGENLKGIDKTTCLVFSDLYGSRVERQTVDDVFKEEEKVQ